MQSLFLLSLGATCLGGAIALGALFHRFSLKPSVACVRTKETRASSQASCVSNETRFVLEELERRERSFDALRKRADDELDAKRQALEALTHRADEAAAALGRALDSVSLAFGSNSRSFRTAVASRACDSASPFEWNDLDFFSPLEPTRRDDLCLRERQAKVA